MTTRYTFFTVFSLGITIAAAQPTITNSDIPVPGDVFLRGDCGYLDPGPGGADQFWDLSALNCTNPSGDTWLDPASTGSGNLFPAATVAETVNQQTV